MWNDADVAAVLGSLLGDGEVSEQMDLPRRLGPSFDRVLVSGKPVGVSTGRTVSRTYER
jgi:vanillate/3-O-methylgallate O-demethylase